MNVDNCPRCGKIYVKNIREACPSCIKDLEQQYEKCVKYLRDSRKATITELSEATEVSIKQITKFIREGRISIASMPNMGYPCEVCGTLIRENSLCSSCRQRLVKDVSNAREDELRAEELRKQDGHLTFNIQDRLKNKR
ncbi:TIGR03826 family flagellar region protein [Paenibacillus sp. MBLB4367]|uniref:TIGR03826 family flagellar region protein n=1 Tax=Paenibacillus sp. MBLB4367 TaxID=3384767 RepID=UPI0039080BC7